MLYEANEIDFMATQQNTILPEVLFNQIWLIILHLCTIDNGTRFLMWNGPKMKDKINGFRIVYIFGDKIDDRLFPYISPFLLFFFSFHLCGL